MATVDLGHAILGGLVAIVIYFLQRELSRNDELRKEAITLVKNCNERIDGHERRLGGQSTSIKLLEQRIGHVEEDVKALKDHPNRSNVA